MPSKIRHIKFYKYFREWVDTYKVGQVRPVTLNKYYLVAKKIKSIAPDLDLGDMTRADVQRLINIYGQTHEYPTVLDFLHHIQAPLRDAVYEGWIAKDPTYKVHATSQVKHKETRFKYLESDQVAKLVKVLERDDSPEALMFLFDLKTGLRFAEIFGLTMIVDALDNYYEGC
ncbi:phage integrase SAM-like domain-containing protein [Lactobacillus gasseri]|uniref:Integrase n=1 Tax=Lactobacillus gasseri TaxID=1596 RepID=A0ABY3BC30_LACGS|nr:MULTISPECIES: phage integrase SAM-like domain-containing protein [Lactobacillus]MCZ3932532.1 phage integrase SAM-like domain-containing protein [Lactobacillus gasseri]MCZ3934166.1 phage integrase SAM-like domain-containing protein [Lactobacillus gasseri]MCZ3936144.1 phage integrase SAM-like domain-containing protein [Lactobacillus gasseri]MCZ3943493.1 phage integrase SAM-like domain-containing protein [Lactobacillus gasseri]MCZ3949051.1 phage integrase SAM-like domain-containing protein [La